MNTVLTFGQAMDQARKGLAVSASNWGFVDRLSTHVVAMEVEKAKIWSPVTNLVMSCAGVEYVTVQPYSTKVTQVGKELHVNNYIPNNEDMNNLWMLSTTARRLTSLGIGEDNDDEFTLGFELTDINDFYYFKDLYKSNCIGYNRNVIFIGGSVSANIRNATIYNIMEVHMDNRTPSIKSNDGFIADLDFLKDGWLGYCDERAHNYQFINLDAVDLSFANQINLKDSIIIIDKYSLDQFDMSNGKNAYDYVSGIVTQLSNPIYHLDITKEYNSYNSI